MKEIEWSIFIPVAVACIAAGAALWGAWTANQAHAANRRLAQEMKIAEFRQAWLDRLRTRLADFLALMTILYQDTDAPTDEQKRQRAQQLSLCLHEIMMMLNMDDPNSVDLLREIRSFRRELLDGSDEASSAKIVELSQAILNRGWDRIKEDIRTKGGGSR
ncbi:hypothetical protein [Paracoccus xiamenensis]|uniref:hypothetical protein n=1 Tax=Paracoccus xiamenensis TaxID=2714901 RepID=UPI00140CEE6F|nr:hypothetical protein [Paracoccus xiamenensis]NHF72807.1 hypothetical protein [Paracoccus xiamenensis]